MRLITRETCRICGSRALMPVVSLGDQYLASTFAVAPGARVIQRRIPLEVVRCAREADERACGFVQLRHTVPPELIYHSYGYKSGINQTMTHHLHSIARSLEIQMELTHGDIAVDVGSNDGTLLAGYTARGLRRVGFEPSTAAHDIAPDAYTLIEDYFSAATFRRVFPQAKAKVITSVAVFYDLEDPNAFVSDAAAILDPGGCWLLELSYLPLMLERRSFDTICHEHLGYYSLFPLEYLLASHGLQLVDVALNEINGGSLRAWIAHRGADSPFIDGKSRKRVDDLRRREFELGLNTREPYQRFSSEIEGIRKDLQSLIRNLRSQGKVIYGYGASTKGNVILQFCDLDARTITAIADRNPRSGGRRRWERIFPSCPKQKLARLSQTIC